MRVADTDGGHRRRPAVVDSSFWIHAHRSGLLPYVRRHYVVHYTAAVSVELDPRFPSGRTFQRLVQSGALIEVVSQRDAITEFGSGERSALNVAIEHPDWILLIDDRRPFEEAERRGLRALCSPVLVVVLYAQGALREATATRILAALRASGTLSPRLVDASAALFDQVRRARRPTRPPAERRGES
jgi:predicted nucleic acid-binding protein